MVIKYLVLYPLIILILRLFNPNIFSQSTMIEKKIWQSDITNYFNQNDIEKIENRNFDLNEFGLNRSISNVNNPTISVLLAPEEINTGIAILIFPGGGYHRIVIDKEGYDVARWLNSKGITAIVVKYRTAPQEVSIRGMNANLGIRNSILSDAREAIRIVHRNAKEWKIDTDKIGVIGFSAGGHLVALLCTTLEVTINSDSDNQIKANNNFNFMALIYAALDNDFKGADFQKFPPTFIATCSDDITAPPENSVGLFNSLENKNESELHIYSKGGHGFGLGIYGGAVSAWKSNFLNWLQDLHLLK